MVIKKQKAMSLVEMIIAVGIFVIGMTAFTLLFSRSWETNKFIMEEGQSSLTASQSVDTLMGELRRVRQGDNGSYPIESADDNDLVVYIDIDHDDDTERVHYFLDETNKKVKMGVAEPIAGNPVTYPTGDTTVLSIISYVENDGDNPLFYYYNSDYPASATPISVPVSSSNLSAIRLIRFNLYINTNPNSAPDNINLESFAQLRNIN